MAILHQLFCGSYGASASVTAWTMVLTATGTGAGVATFRVYATGATSATLDGNGHFYTDSSGTLNESQTWTLSAGYNLIYIKVASGSSSLVFADRTKITQWRGPYTYYPGYASQTNGPALSCALAGAPPLTSISIEASAALAAITGDIGLLNNSLTYLALGNAASEGLTGTLSSAGITYISLLGTYHEVSVDVSAMSGLTYCGLYGSASASITGDASALTSCTRLVLDYGGLSKCYLSGNLASLAAVTILQVVAGSSTMTYPTTGVAQTGTKSRLYLRSQAFTQAEGDALVIDYAAATWIASGGLLSFRVTGGLSGSSAVTAALAALATKNVTVTIPTS